MYNFHEMLGLIGSICFAVATWPQAYHAIKNKTAKGVSGLYGSLLFVGGVCSTIYAAMTGQYVIVPNFLCGAIGIGIVMFYKIKEELIK